MENNLPEQIISNCDPIPNMFYYSIPLTVKMEESGILKYKFSINKITQSPSKALLEYNLNNTNWKIISIEELEIIDNFSYNDYVFSINLSSNDEISFRMTDEQIEGYGCLGYRNNFIISGKCSIYGNILSLVFKNDYKEYSYHLIDNTLSGLFSNSDITDASGLILPKYVCCNKMFSFMFAENKHLINPPMLKHISMTFISGGNGFDKVFAYMFYNCSDEIGIPVLPDISNSIWTEPFYNMFYKKKEIPGYDDEEYNEGSNSDGSWNNSSNSFSSGSF